VRVCVFVKLPEGVPWERLVEHALATQTRVWGGDHNVVVPLWEGIEDDEVFWRLVGRFDPDIVGLHTPSWTDAEAIAPEIHAKMIEKVRASLDAGGFGDEVRERQLRDLGNEAFWEHWQLPEDFGAAIIERFATLRWGDEPRLVVLNGVSSAPHPLTDVTALNELPRTVSDLHTNLGDLETLLLTHAAGRLLPALKSELVNRGIALDDLPVDHLQFLPHYVWPDRLARHNNPLPHALAGAGLARRLTAREREKGLVVLGDHPRDFTLFHVLSHLRPHVFWCPASRLEDETFLRGLGRGIEYAVQDTAEAEVGVVSTTVEAAAQRFKAQFEAHRIAGRSDLRPMDWQTAVPSSLIWAVDARSDRRVSLIVHRGKTAELPTPVPVSVSTASEDFTELRWMVDVEVEDWTPLRHQSLGGQLLSAPLLTEQDVRTGVAGPSYFGPSAFIQQFLGLEGSTVRPRLSVRPLRAQIELALDPETWQVSESDKGIYARETAHLFGGFGELAETLHSTRTRSLLNAYIGGSAKDQRPGYFLSDRRRRYLTLEDIRQLAGAEPATDALVADLCDAGITIRGHILECELCRSISFYALREDQTFRCTRCSTEQRATRARWIGEAEPRFVYGLNEVVFQFLNHRGDIPLLATYHHFAVTRGAERRPLDVGFEMNFTSSDNGRREHDIVALLGSELWLGEATTVERLDTTNGSELERLKRLRETATALNARGVLFVTTADHFGGNTKGRIGAVFGQSAGRFEVTLIEAFDTTPDQP